MTTTQDFLTAIKTGNRGDVGLMLDVDPTLANVRDENGQSAVLIAAYYQQPEIAQLLVQQGAELNLFEACAAGELACVKEWIEKQSELINAYAPDGFQSLGLAAFFGHAEIVEILLKHGAQVNSASHNAMRVMPLHSAIANQHTEIVRMLLDHDADVNAMQADDFTPLHEAAQNGMLEVVQWLIERGADINPQLSSNDKTPLALALEHEHEEVVNLLKQHGALLNPRG